MTNIHSNYGVLHQTMGVFGDAPLIKLTLRGGKENPKNYNEVVCCTHSAKSGKIFVLLVNPICRGQRQIACFAIHLEKIERWTC